MHRSIPFAFIALLVAIVRTSAADPLQWHSLGGAAGMIETHDDDEGSVQHLIEIGTGRDSRLVAIGWYAVAGDTMARNGAQWDGQSWSPLPEDCVPAFSAALRVGSKLLIGGGQNINIWDGTACEVFEDKVDGIIYALGLYKGKLVAAGSFTRIGGVTARSIAMWTGTTWLPFGLGVTSSRTISSVVEYDGKLIVAGDFESIGGVAAHRIAQWDGSTWSPLGSGIQGFVYHLATYNNRLIVGGYMTAAGGVPVSGLAQWNGAVWSPVGGGVDGAVNSSIVQDGRLVVCGAFSMAGGLPAQNVAAWNGTAWSDLGLDGEAGAVAIGSFRGELVASGYVRSAGWGFIPVFRFDGNRWKALSPGTGGPVYAFTPYNGQLAVGGEFSVMGEEPVRRVGLFDGRRFTRLGSGILNEYNIVHALVQSGNELVAGGHFNNIDGQTVRNIAAWNGTAWHDLFGGMSGEVSALAVFQNELIAGGNFLEAGGLQTPYVAAWNGASWRRMGSGFNERVRALAVVNGVLYAGGDFSAIGPFTRIAQWDGVAWQPLGTGIPAGYVSAFTEYQGKLIAGGSFGQAGALLVSNIAQWDGNTWSRLGDGLGGSVDSLTVFEGELYAGGSFLTASGISANSIAKWNGSAWSGVAGGVQVFNQTYQQVRVAALGVLDGNLYVGGMFLQAGPHLSPFMAKWGTDSQPPLIAADSLQGPALNLR